MGSGGPPPTDPNNVETKPAENAPWFANLPPEAREAMRNNSQRRPPPEYQRRTQEYFEDLEP